MYGVVGGVVVAMVIRAFLFARSLGGASSLTATVVEVFVCSCVCSCVRAFVCVRLCSCVRVFVRSCAFAPLPPSLYIYIYIYIYIYLYISIYIYISIRRHLPGWLLVCDVSGRGEARAMKSTPLATP